MNKIKLNEDKIQQKIASVWEQKNNGTIIGSGGKENKCNFSEINEKAVHWPPDNFPIPVAISKDMSDKRSKIFRTAIDILNNSYREYLKSHVPDWRARLYPYSIFKYDPIDPDDLYPNWIWCVIPIICTGILLNRILYIPYEGRVIVLEDHDSVENEESHAMAIVRGNDNGYIEATQIFMRPDLKIMSSRWHDDFSNPKAYTTDYLTVVLHELFHIPGPAHNPESETNDNILMYERLSKKHRIKEPNEKDWEQFFLHV